MNREDWEAYIAHTYPAVKDYPWTRYPDYAVFRHRGDRHRRCFAIFMRLSKDKLGLCEAGDIEVVNLKCDPLLSGSLLLEAGMYPAYHMNKEHWITVALDGRVAEEQVRLLIEWSFYATAPKRSRAGTEEM